MYSSCGASHPSPAFPGAFRGLANVMGSECSGFGRQCVFLEGADGYWLVPKDRQAWFLELIDVIVSGRSDFTGVIKLGS